MQAALAQAMGITSSLPSGEVVRLLGNRQRFMCSVEHMGLDMKTNGRGLAWVKRLGLSLLLVLTLAGGSWYLRRGYGETGVQGYAYAIALFSACNQRDEGKLQDMAKRIQRDLQAGKLGRQEAEWLGAIIAKGRRGDWRAANRDVRRLMEDQVRYSPAP